MFSNICLINISYQYTTHASSMIRERFVKLPVVMAYARRWQVEMCYRACKTDLAMESPRLWFWENRLKLLLMVSLVYAFLLSLLAATLTFLVQDILHHCCHRTGERYRQAAIPLSRLRAALSALWLTHPSHFTTTPQTPKWLMFLCPSDVTKLDNRERYFL